MGGRDGGMEHRTKITGLLLQSHAPFLATFLYFFTWFLRIPDWWHWALSLGGCCSSSQQSHPGASWGQLGVSHQWHRSPCLHLLRKRYASCWASQLGGSSSSNIFLSYTPEVYCGAGSKLIRSLVMQISPSSGPFLQHLGQQLLLIPKGQNAILSKATCYTHT